jgi:hypothetical protein
MALLSQAIRTAAITGSTDSLFSRIAGRQGGAWAERTVAAAMPVVPPPGDAARRMRELDALRRRGVITEDELRSLRARLET